MSIDPGIFDPWGCKNRGFPLTRRIALTTVLHYRADCDLWIVSRKCKPLDSIRLISVQLLFLSACVRCLNLSLSFVGLRCLKCIVPTEVKTKHTLARVGWRSGDGRSASTVCLPGQLGAAKDTNTTSYRRSTKSKSTIGMRTEIRLKCRPLQADVTYSNSSAKRR